MTPSEELAKAIDALIVERIAQIECNTTAQQRRVDDKRRALASYIQNKETGNDGE